MQALEEYRKPRDALLILLSDYIRICAPRLEELEEAPLPPRYTVPELLDSISVNVRVIIAFQTKSPGGILAVFMTGGGGDPTKLHITDPKKYTRLKIYTQKIPGIKILNLKYTRFKYLNTDLFNQTDVKT